MNYILSPTAERVASQLNSSNVILLSIKPLSFKKFHPLQSYTVHLLSSVADCRYVVLDLHSPSAGEMESQI